MKAGSQAIHKPVYMYIHVKISTNGEFISIYRFRLLLRLVYDSFLIFDRGGGSFVEKAKKKRKRKFERKYEGNFNKELSSYYELRYRIDANFIFSRLIVQF